MNRIVLALLALFAGLAAESAPVQARINGAGETEIGAVENVRSGTRSNAAQALPVDLPVARQNRHGREAGRMRPERTAVFIPSVLFGADRAFE